MIRYATLNDLDFIYELSKKTFETSFSKETLKEYIEARETFHVFVSEEDELIGFIILWVSDIYSQLIDVVVNENSRGKGYGKNLLEFAFNFLIKTSVKSLSLEVSQSNKNAIKLYESCGFRKEKTLKNYYKKADALLYIKEF